jgi:transcriptional regulator with XRE-family HTH domain
MLKNGHVRQLRRRALMTQAELAEAAGIAAGTLSRIETNHRAPRLSSIRKLAEALGVTPTELIDQAAEDNVASPAL